MEKKLELGRDVADCTIMDGYAYHTVGLLTFVHLGCTSSFYYILLLLCCTFKQLNKLLIRNNRLTPHLKERIFWNDWRPLVSNLITECARDSLKYSVLIHSDWNHMQRMLKTCASPNRLYPQNSAPACYLLLRPKMLSSPHF